MATLLHWLVAGLKILVQSEFCWQGMEEKDDDDERQRSGNCWQKILLLVDEKLVDEPKLLVRLVVEELKLVEVLEVRLVADDELHAAGNWMQKGIMLLLVKEVKLLVRLVVEEPKLVLVDEVRLEVEEKLVLVEKLLVRLVVDEKLVPDENELLLTGAQRQH